MSDLFEVRQKVEEGAEWRGDITVAIDDDERTLTVRQLRDPEFWEVMSKIDTDELEELQSDLPEEKMEELRDLRTKDDLTDEESDRLAALQEEIETEDINLFEVISRDTYEGIKQAAVYGVEPDMEDIQHALTNFTEDIREAYGGSSQEEARQYVNDQHIKPMIEQSTDFVSFSIGIKVLTETIGDTGN